MAMRHSNRTGDVQGQHEEEDDERGDGLVGDLAPHVGPIDVKLTSPMSTCALSASVGGRCSR